MSDSIDFIYDLIKEKGFLALSDCEGCCPCGSLELKGISFRMHCWRGGCNDCKYSGLHLSFDRDNYSYSLPDLEKLGKLCLKQIKETWNNTDFELVIEDKDSP